MSYWNGSIKIGNLEFPRFIGGPLDGITDSPFRKLVREFSSSELLYTEMRHVACIANDKGGQRALKFEQLERPLNYQVAANSTLYIEKACDLILAKGVDMIDLNIGCPAKNVIGSGSGSALMANVPRLKEIVTLFRKKIPNIPFTVKIRAGFKSQNAVEVAKLLEDCGVDALAIHPRLQTQRFEGRPDYALAAEVKQAVKVPVIISGGVVNWATAKMIHEQTGVDGYLIGRGIWSRPWKLQELREHSQGREYLADNTIVLHSALKHLDYMLAHYGNHGLYNFRKHLPFYIKGAPDAATIRERLVVSHSAEEVQEGLKSFFRI
ncbi:MAG: tRNA-dihydrouridine synthase [Candidatus Dependentiae bacterium]|nr:tRNA-dihydrouridine synthase [Candidatus Dependentiae bacterium]